MLAIFLVIIGLSLLVLVHELGHFLAARYFKLYIEEFGIGFPPRLLKKKIGETFYSINAIPLGGFVKIYGENFETSDHIKKPERSFAYQSAWRRGLIIVAGVFMNFLFGWLIISSVFFIGSPSAIVIDNVIANSPAALVSLQKQDQVIGFKNAVDLIQYVDLNKGKEIILQIKRKDDQLTVAVTPRLQPPAGEGALGIALHDAGLPKHGFFTSLYKGLTTSLGMIAAIFLGLYQAIFSPQYILGPIGIFDVAVSTGELGLIYLLQFVGLISLNLVVLNILPIPALDGGRLLFVVVEKIRGKKFKPETENRANTIGFALLLGLILLITIKDIAGLL